MGKLSSKSKWSWKAHFLSHNPEIMQNWITFKDVQMLLLSFFEIPYLDKLAKNVQKRYVQVIPRSTNYSTLKCPYYRHKMKFLKKGTL